MAFAEWVAAHVRVSSKMHAKITVDDKMSFFQQLSTLVCSGTPLLRNAEVDPVLWPAAEQSVRAQLDYLEGLEGLEGKP